MRRGLAARREPQALAAAEELAWRSPSRRPTADPAGPARVLGVARAAGKAPAVAETRREAQPWEARGAVPEPTAARALAAPAAAGQQVRRPAAPPAAGYSAPPDWQGGRSGGSRQACDAGAAQVQHLQRGQLPMGGRSATLEFARLSSCNATRSSSGGSVVICVSLRSSRRSEARPSSDGKVVNPDPCRSSRCSDLSACSDGSAFTCELLRSSAVTFSLARCGIALANMPVSVDGGNLATTSLPFLATATCSFASASCGWVRP